MDWPALITPGTGSEIGGGQPVEYCHKPAETKVFMAECLLQNALYLKVDYLREKQLLLISRLFLFLLRYCFLMVIRSLLIEYEPLSPLHGNKHRIPVVCKYVSALCFPVHINKKGPRNSFSII